MPRASEAILDAGDRFPGIDLAKLGGGTMHLPEDLAGAWGVVLFYRGHW